MSQGRLPPLRGPNIALGPLNKAEVTSPLLTHVNTDSYSRIFELINNDPTAPETALRVLAHKVQSPQEKEAIGALTHLGDSTSERVKSKCIELLVTWNRDLGEKYPKIGEAYQLLKSQGVIKEDQITPAPAKATGDEEHSSRNSIFENSRHAEVSPFAASFLLCHPLNNPTASLQTLAKLLKSRNPDDLQRANEIIKTIVDEVSSFVMNLPFESWLDAILGEPSSIFCLLADTYMADDLLRTL
ncbi:unnamed protein product [Dibothriocephalus latus]|uniref:VHS domain-containing protein n=1 Tax=Dibothriocephalus latus TaxID=60516 RepID=A0A3P7LAY6_DIBLA|nr:unnamed protein product [Dibothriocephalus latus]